VEGFIILFQELLIQELEKQGSRKLRLNAKETMRIAEKLYTQGFISYPRTETNIFPKELNLGSLVEKQVNNGAWGDFARGLLDTGITPRQGKKSDQAHPPIHPTKYTDTLQGSFSKSVFIFHAINHVNQLLFINRKRSAGL